MFKMNKKKAKNNMFTTVLKPNPALVYYNVNEWKKKSSNR